MPVGVTLVAAPHGDGLAVMLSVDLMALMQLQEELGDINSQLTNLTRERTKAKVRLEAALAEVARQNEELGALNEELSAQTEELEAQTEELAYQADSLRRSHEARVVLERENQQLHQLDELKNQFIGIISHELKTPLNFVTGFSSILADEVLGPLNPRQAEAMEKVLGGAERLDWLINELLDANKLQAGKLSVAVENVALPALLADLLDEMRPSIALKELHLEPLADCPARVWADPQRLHQVVRNLISNAVKFTPAGGTVRLTAHVDGPMVRVAVTDTGIGVPPESLDQLFQPFFQVDSTATRRYGGTGLGLSIVQSLVELMGGQVGVESTLGQGSTFWFTVPLKS
jgi:signal transduction histidine kinase